MAKDPVRDTITISDEDGNMKEFFVEGLFTTDEESYALLSSDKDTILMRVEETGDDQYLVGITDPDERDSILDAYQIAMEAADEHPDSPQA